MKIRKIYVASPDGKDNGGGESLHQLVDACNRLGYDAYIYYFDSNRSQVLENMSIYHIKVAGKVEDNIENLLICPEMYTYPLKRFKHIRKGIWFLSLDYYLRSFPFYKTEFLLHKWHMPRLMWPIVLLAVLIKTDATFKSFDFKKDFVKYFLYNVEYAHQYIEGKCTYDHISQYLCGPLNDIYFMDDEKRERTKERIVAYNPKKADAFIKKIEDAFSGIEPKIKFVPVKGMNQKEVKDLLSVASVYIDFGFFPGPERLPREAAMMQCNIITSNLGSASNEVDVPINPKYKFALEDDKIAEIVELIRDMVEHYDSYVREFDSYREKVVNQKECFVSNVRMFMKRIEEDEA